MVIQLIGYVLSGCCATTAHIVILFWLVEQLFMTPVPASSIGFFAGAATGFLLNRKFVFKDPSAKHFAFVKYCIMAGVGAGLNALLLSLLIYQVNLYYLYAQIIATICLVLINFVCCKLWIFKEVKESREKYEMNETKTRNKTQVMKKIKELADAK